MNTLGLRFVKYINDPVWGEIPLTSLELDLINTTAFRRLQHVRQMGFAYLGFPTANHRRYEHCLGAMHVAHLLSNILIDVAEPDIANDLQYTHIQAIRVAALLHDIGHAPYSHAFEEAVRKNPSMVTIYHEEVLKDPKYVTLSPLGTGGRYRHEFFTKHIIQTDPELSAILTTWAERNGAFPAQQIAALAVGEATWAGLAPFNPVISGDFDADRIDYVCRDSYYCGSSQKFRIEELRRNLSLRRSADGKSFSIRLLEGAIPAVTTLLWYRYRLMKTVHLDVSNRIATQALIKGLTAAFSKLHPDEDRSEQADLGKLELLLEFHTKMTDENCNEFLWEKTKTALISNLIKGELPHEVYAVEPRHLQPEEKLFLHFLLAEPRAIAEFDRKLDLHLRMDVFADIRMAKSPKFGTLVADTEGQATDRSVFDTYYTPHGIVIDSLNTLSVFLYHANRTEFQSRIDELPEPGGPEPFKFPMKPLRRAVYDSIRETYEQLRNEWAERKVAFSLECWLCILNAVETCVHDTVKQRPWIAGDKQFQTFVHGIMEDIGDSMKINPGLHWTSADYSPEVFHDLEILQHHGLVDHIHVPVGGPGAEQPWIGTRLDRRLSNFGRRYAKRYLNGSWHGIEISRRVTERFKPISKEVTELLTAQQELGTADLFGPPRADIYSKINDLREKISSGGFVALWISS